MDLLHPLTSITWQHCNKPPWGWWKDPTHCAALRDKVAVLTRSRNAGVPDVIYISSTDLQSWTAIELQYEDMSLTIYQSKFVAVGGWDRSTNEATNTVLTSTTGLRWEPSLPPMPTKRSGTSSVSTTSPEVEVLVVAGGCGSEREDLNVVEVLLIDQWITIDPLPTPASLMDSTVHEGNLYFMTRYNNTSNTITTCNCTSLISCTESNHTTSIDSLPWNQFQAPGRYWSIVSISSQLIIIDCRGTARCYSSTTQSWVEASVAGDRPLIGCRSVATVLPTGKILYCHGDSGVYRGTTGGICTLMMCIVYIHAYTVLVHVLCMCACMFMHDIMHVCMY